jgi:hypothetical protein
MPREKHHQIRHPPMIDVCIGLCACFARTTRPLSRIRRQMTCHILVHFFLQVDPHRAIRANHFVGAHASRRRHISTWIRYSNVHRIVANRVMRAFHSRRHKALRELLL